MPFDPGELAGRKLKLRKTKNRGQGIAEPGRAEQRLEEKEMPNSHRLNRLERITTTKWERFLDAFIHL